MKKETKRLNLVLFIILFLSFFLMSLFALTDEKRLVVPEDILQLKSLSDPQISPTGDWIAFVVTQFEESKKTNSEVWLVSKDRKTLKHVTKNPGPDFAPRWSPDGKTIAFISQRNELKEPQIFTFSLSDEELKQATNEKGGIRDLKWSPDNKSIAFLMRDPQTDEELERHKKGDDAFTVDEDYKHTRLYILDVQRCKSRLVTTQDMTVWHFNWSPDSKKMVILASPIPTAEGNEYQSHLGVIDLESGKESILSRKTNAQASPSFSPDGKWIAYIGPIGTFKERGIIKVVSVEGGEPIELLRDYSGNVWDVTWHPKKNELLAAVAKGSIHTFSSINLKGEIQNLFEMNHSRIPYWGNFWSVCSEGKYVAFLNERVDSPKEVWISNIDGSDKRQLTSFNKI